MSLLLLCPVIILVVGAFLFLLENLFRLTHPFDHFLYLLDHPDMPRFLINEFAAHPGRTDALRMRFGVLLGRVLASLQTDMEAQAAQGAIARMKLTDLLLDAVSLNVFVFLAYPIVGSLFASGVDTRAFFMARLEENLTVIRKRLQPDLPCESTSPSCSPDWLP